MVASIRLDRTSTESSLVDLFAWAEPMRLTLVADFFKRVIIVFSPGNDLLITRSWIASGLMFDPCSRELLHQDYPAGLFERAHAMVPPAPTTDTTKETLVCSGSASKNCRKADMLLADALIIAMIGFFELGSGFEQLWFPAALQQDV